MATFTVERLDYEEDADGIVQTTDVVDIGTVIGGLSALSDDTPMGTLSNVSAPIRLLTVDVPYGTRLRCFNLNFVMQGFLTATSAEIARITLGFPANPPNDGQRYKLTITDGILAFVLDT